MRITLQARTAEHYRRLFSQLRDTEIGYALAANGAYAARHGVCEAEHRHTSEWAALALDIRLRRSDHLSAAEALAEMDAAPFFSMTPASAVPPADGPVPEDPAADAHPAAGVWGARAV